MLKLHFVIKPFCVTTDKSHQEIGHRRPYYWRVKINENKRIILIRVKFFGTSTHKFQYKTHVKLLKF